MTDLITRLREWAYSYETPPPSLLKDAAAELTRLRSALKHIVSVMGPTVPPCCGGCAAEWDEALTTAREALRKTT